MSINVPFNFQPTSVSVKTSSYTIPAGSYAYVEAQAEDGGTFTIDGSTALNAKAQTSVNSESDSFALSGSGSLTVNVATNKLAILRLYLSAITGNPTLTISGNLITTSLTTAYNNVYYLGSGDSFVISTGSSEQAFGYYTFHEYDPNITETTNTASFWLPTGSVINGSGQWRATVSLYNEIT